MVIEVLLSIILLFYFVQESWCISPRKKSLVCCDTFFQFEQRVAVLVKYTLIVSLLCIGGFFD